MPATPRAINWARPLTKKPPVTGWAWAMEPPETPIPTGVHLHEKNISGGDRQAKHVTVVPHLISPSSPLQPQQSQAVVLVSKGGMEAVRMSSAPGGLANKQRRRNQQQQQQSSQSTPANPEGSSRPLSGQSPLFSHQQSAPGRLTNKQRRRNQRQLNMQHQLTQTRSYHHQHSVPVDNRQYSHSNPAQVLKLQKPPSSSEGEVTGTDVTTGSKVKFSFLSSPLHVISHEATTSPALGDETLSAIQEASGEPLIKTSPPRIKRQAQGDLPSSQTGQQLLLQESPSYSDNGRCTHPDNDVISKCGDVTTIDSTNDSETITSSEHSSQVELQALTPRTTSSKYDNIRIMNSDLGSYITTSPPQDSAEDDTSSKNDVCKTHLECLTSAPTNEMLPADMTFDPPLSSHEQSSSIDSTSSPHSKVSNVPATVDHCCQGHTPELHPSLDPTTRPILDQDKCVVEVDILHSEDSLTYSHETQILLPTSGPPIDPHNTREYIPTWFNPVATLSQCTHDGRWYYDEHNDFGLEIPAGAIPEGESITIDIGVALYGPFQYPEGLRPVSPVFWVCVRDQNHFQFLKPVKVTIPHCLNVECHDDIESLGLSFLKGDHEMNPQQMYQFQQAEGDVLIEPLKKYGVILTTHFCSLCISCKDTMKLIEKAHFCLYSVIPHVISPDEPSFAYFFITFLLKTCLKTVKSQMEDLNLQNYEQKPEEFQFRARRAKFQLSHIKELEIVLPKADSLPAGWMVGMQGKKKVI